MVMLVQTWLGTLMYGWLKIVELNKKKLELHNAQRAATGEGNDGK